MKKTYDVKRLLTFSFSFEIEANDRVEAERKAKEFFKNCDDDYFLCDAVLEEEVYKIVPQKSE